MADLIARTKAIEILEKIQKEHAQRTCSRASLQQAQAMLAKKDISGKNTNPTFSNDTARWGREYRVGGYSWAGVSPYKDAEVKSTTWSTSTGLPTGVTMIAVKVKQAKTFLDYCQSNSPEIF